MPLITKFIASEFKEVAGFLTPSKTDIDEAMPLSIYGEVPILHAIGETEAGGIHDQMKTYEGRFEFESNGQRQLSTRGLVNGIANEKSYEDAHFLKQGFFVGDIEFKGAEGSILAAVKQAAVTNTNFAMNLFKCGALSQDIKLPTIGSNGMVIHFGVTVLLDKSFPTYFPISKLLDLTDPTERKTAAAYFMKANLLASRTSNACEGRESQADVHMQLDKDKTHHYIKIISPEIFNKGFGLVTPRDCMDHLNIGNPILDRSTV